MECDSPPKQNKETMPCTRNGDHINNQCSISQKLHADYRCLVIFLNEVLSPSWWLTWCLNCNHRGRTVKKETLKSHINPARKQSCTVLSSAALKCHARPSPRDHMTPEHKTQCLLSLDRWGSKGFNLGFLILLIWPLFYFAQRCHSPTSWYFSKAAQRDLETNLIWGSAL